MTTLQLPAACIHFHPRESWTWSRFLETPRCSIALDGMVSGGPTYDPAGLHVNFDHHDGVVREATMSTAMQVYFAIKGGLMRRFAPAEVFVNDTDQDTALAAWLLAKHKLFEGPSSVPHIQRLLALTDRWDITGGAFPMNLDDVLVEEHNWVFDAYSSFRKSGALARATPEELRGNLEATFGRLDRYLMGSAERLALDTRHTFIDRLDLGATSLFFVDEIGGNTARYFLYNHRDMQAFVARVATRPDGRFVYSIGRRSRYVDFDIPRMLQSLSAHDIGPWGGSDIIGGSNRERGSALDWPDIRRILVAP